MPFFDRHWEIRLVAVLLFAVGGLALLAWDVSTALPFDSALASRLTPIWALGSVTALVLLTIAANVLAAAFAGRDRTRRRREAIAGLSAAIPRARLAPSANVERLADQSSTFTWSGKRPQSLEQLLLWCLVLLLCFAGAVASCFVIISWLGNIIPPLHAQLFMLFYDPPLYFLIPSFVLVAPCVVFIVRFQRISGSRSFNITVSATGLTYHSGRKLKQVMEIPWAAMRLFEVARYSVASLDTTLTRAYLYILYTDQTAVRWASGTDSDGFHETQQLIDLIAAHTGLVPRTFDERLYPDGDGAPARSIFATGGDVLYPICYQLAVAALVVAVPLSGDRRADGFFAYLFAAGVLTLVLFAAANALARGRELRANRHAAAAAPMQPTLPVPPSSASGRYIHHYRLARGHTYYYLGVLILGLVLATDLIPFVLLQFNPHAPSAAGEIITIVLLPFACIGLATVGIGLFALFKRYTLLADARGLIWSGRRRVVIRWDQIQHLAIKRRGDQITAYQLIAVPGALRIGWFEQTRGATGKQRDPLPVSARDMAALILAYTGIRPDFRVDNGLSAEAWQRIDTNLDRFETQLEKAIHTK